MSHSWYLMRSKPNKEAFLCGSLLSHEIEAYYPCLRARALNPRERRDKPYFPSYLFIKIDPERTTAAFLAWLPGSRGLVKMDDEPLKAPEELIVAIRLNVEMINHPGMPDRPASVPMFASGLSGTARARALLDLLRESMPEKSNMNNPG